MMLEQELNVFQRQLPELLKHSLGQFALIYKDELLGTFTTQTEAYTAGLQRVGNEPFLIKQIQRDSPGEQLPAYSLGLLNAGH